MTQTVTYKGVELYIWFTYDPGEPMVMYYPDGSGHPGSAEEITIEEILFEGIDVYEIYESLDLIGEIEQLIDTDFDPYTYDFT